MNDLTVREQCERIIKSKQGVLYLYGKPGEAKTSILKSIAIKNNWQYFDFRLSQRDSSEIIGVPFKDKLGDDYVMDYAIPKIYHLANQKPTLIVFEELNRGVLETRNAALQIFLERVIGTFEFNENVYFASTGNLGDEDDCDVEEFDRALWGRLAPLHNVLTYDEWNDNFAKENINPLINNFVKNNLDHWYVAKADAKDNSKTYTCVRSLTYMSNFVGKDEKNLNKILSDIQAYGPRYLHPSTVARMIRYFQDLVKLNAEDILNRFDEIKPILDTLNKSYLNEYVEKIKLIKVEDLKKAQMENLLKFLDYIPDDERAGYLSKLIEDTVSDEDIESMENNNKKEGKEGKKEKNIHKNALKIVETYRNFCQHIFEKMDEEDKKAEAEMKNSNKDK